jgi:SMC interacting uncharacterized protein involved in chromosome segregation
MPELVLGKEGNYSIDYLKMVPYLLKAIQDQHAKIQLQDEELVQLRAGLNNSLGSAKNEILTLIAQMQFHIQQQEEEIKLLKQQLKN